MTCKTLLVAENASVDAVTGKLSITNAVQNLPVPVLPFALPRMTLLAVFEKTAEEPSDYTVKIRVMLNGGLWGEQGFPISFANKDQAFLRVGITNVIVDQPGSLSFDVLYEEVSLQTLSLPIALAGEPKMEPSISPGERSS